MLAYQRQGKHHPKFGKPFTPPYLEIAMELLLDRLTLPRYQHEISLPRSEMRGSALIRHSASYIMPVLPALLLV